MSRAPGFPFFRIMIAIVGPVVLIGAIAYMTDRPDASMAQETPLSHADGCLVASQQLKDRLFEERPDCRDVITHQTVADGTH